MRIRERRVDVARGFRSFSRSVFGARSFLGSTVVLRLASF